MSEMKDWDELSPHEKIQTFPKRHPHTFKCMLYLYIELGIPFSAVDRVMQAMGYMKMDVRVETEGFSFGAPTYACPEAL